MPCLLFAKRPTWILFWLCLGTAFRPCPIFAWNIPLPGGGRVSYKKGILRIRFEDDHNLPPMPPTDAKVSANVLKAIQVRDTKTAKGYGAYCIQPLPKHTFLGFYEGTPYTSIENLANKEYIMTLDGGATYLDGYERAQDRSTFSPVHLNHADKSPDCNCLRILRDNDDDDDQQQQCAFFTARDIQVGEELAFDYGANYWRGREQDKI